MPAVMRCWLMVAVLDAWNSWTASLADGESVEVVAHRVVDRIGVVRVAEAVFQLAAGKLRTDGERPLVDEDVFPERRIFPEFVVDVGGDQQVAVHQAAIGQSQPDGFRLRYGKVVVGIARSERRRET